MAIRRVSVLFIAGFIIGLALGIVLEKQHVPGSILLVTARLIHSRAQPDIPVAPVPITSPVPPELQGKLSLFVLAGQSNMSGRGELPSPSLQPDPRVFMFGNDYHWKIASEPVDDPTNQVDKVSEDIDAGFGPSLAFGKSLLATKPEVSIGLIPCAKGSSTITEWQRSVGDNTLYGSCLKRIRAASPMGQVVGVLFFQGESDALDPNQAPGQVVNPNSWSEMFSTFASNIRTDLQSPRLPIVFAQIGTTAMPSKFVNWQIVKLQQETTRLPNAAMITTDDLPLGDEVHFTAASYITVGQRFAQAFVSLQ